jgi:hypothetical protein
MSTKVMSMDLMLQRTLVAFIQAQVQAYQETIEGEFKEVALVQAKYEVCNLALAAVIFAFLGLDPNKTGERIMLPEEWQEVMAKAHDLICKSGDDYLLSVGIDPADFT